MCYLEDTGLESLNIYYTNVQVYEQLLSSLGEKQDGIQFPFDMASFWVFTCEKEEVLLASLR